MRQKSRGGKGIEKKLRKSCSKDTAGTSRTDSVTKTAGWVDETIKVNIKYAGIKGFDETDAAEKISGKGIEKKLRKSCSKDTAGAGKKVAEEMLQ